MAWSKTFLYSIQSIYYFCRIFCLIPFSIVYDVKQNILTSKVRVIDGVLFVIFILIQLNCSAYYFMSPLLQSSEMPHVLIHCDQIIRALVHFHSSIVIIMNMYNRHKIISIMKMFDTIDEEVTIFNHMIFIFFWFCAITFSIIFRCWTKIVWIL